MHISRHQRRSGTHVEADQVRGVVVERRVVVRHKGVGDIFRGHSDLNADR